MEGDISYHLLRGATHSSAGNSCHLGPYPGLTVAVRSSVLGQINPRVIGVRRGPLPSPHDAAPVLA